MGDHADAATCCSGDRAARPPASEIARTNASPSCGGTVGTLTVLGCQQLGSDRGTEVVPSYGCAVAVECTLHF